MSRANARRRADMGRTFRAAQRVDGSAAPRVVLDKQPLQVARLRCGRCAWEGTFGELVPGRHEKSPWGGVVAGFPGCPVCKTDQWLDRAKEDNETRRSG